MYGDVELPAIVEPLIRDKTLRRLQYIRQLSAVFLHLPGAQGTRLEHCLGVVHLLHHFISRQDIVDKLRGSIRDLLRRHEAVVELLREVYGDEQGSERLVNRLADKLLRGFLAVLTILALVHDVFHPPWSHALEQYALSEIKGVLLKEDLCRTHLDKLLLLFSTVNEDSITGLLGDLLPLREFRMLITRSLDSMGFTRLERALLDLAVLCLIPGDLVQDDDIVRRLARRHFSAYLEDYQALDKLALFLKDFTKLILYPFVKLAIDDSVLDFDRLDYTNRDSLHVYGSSQRIDWRDIVENIDMFVDRSGSIRFRIPQHLKPLIYEYFYARLDNYVRIYRSPETVGYEELLTHIVYVSSILIREFSKDVSSTSVLSMFFLTDEALRIFIQNLIDYLKSSSSSTNYAIAKYIEFLLDKLERGCKICILRTNLKLEVRDFCQKIEHELKLTRELIRHERALRKIAEEMGLRPDELKKLVFDIKGSCPYAGLPMVFIREQSFSEEEVTVCSDVVYEDLERKLCLNVEIPSILTSSLVVIPFSEETTSTIVDVMGTAMKVLAPSEESIILEKL